METLKLGLNHLQLAYLKQMKHFKIFTNYQQIQHDLLFPMNLTCKHFIYQNIITLSYLYHNITFNRALGLLGLKEGEQADFTFFIECLRTINNPNVNIKIDENKQIIYFKA